MSIANLIKGGEAAIADSLWPNTGTIGYVLLLSGALYSGSAIITPATDVIATTAPHGLVTGSRVEFSGGAVPSGLVASTEYFAISLSTTTFKVASSLANAQANSPIDITNAGSSVVVTEKILSTNDPIGVLVNKEVAGFPRAALSGVGAATGFGVKPVAISYTNTGAAYTYQHVLIMRGGNATFGSTAGALFALLRSEGSAQTIAANDAKIIAISLGAQ
jgi:hypothetical protein